MGLILSPILSFVKLVPFWVWILSAVLAWGGWQKHQATVSAAKAQAQQTEIATETQKALQESIAETARRLEAQQEVAKNAEVAASIARADAAGASVAASRLRARLAAIASSTAASGASAPAGRASDGLPNLLADCADRYSSVAAAADRAIVAGTHCVGAYEALSKPTSGR
jgi:hypothetical protein